MLEGLDISRWQGTTPNLSGKSFLFARATYGAVHDGMYATHIANARKAGCLVGAYHFGVGDVSVPDQVHAFLAAAGSVDFYVLDLESNGRHASMTNGQAAAFIGMVKAKGHKIGLYHSDSGFPSLGQDYNWVAKWSVNAPARSWAFWQYRGSPLDLDRFNGSLAKLRALAGKVVKVRYHLSFLGGAFWVYRTDGKPFTDSRGVHYGGTITGRKRMRVSHPTGANCSAPVPYAWPGEGTRRLVVLTEGKWAGSHIGIASPSVKLEVL